jgi:hypothetical protein
VIAVVLDTRRFTCASLDESDDEDSPRSAALPFSAGFGVAASTGGGADEAESVSSVAVAGLDAEASICPVDASAGGAAGAA